MHEGSVLTLCPSSHSPDAEALVHGAQLLPNLEVSRYPHHVTGRRVTVFCRPWGVCLEGSVAPGVQGCPQSQNVGGSATKQSPRRCTPNTHTHTFTCKHLWERGRLKEEFKYNSTRCSTPEAPAAGSGRAARRSSSPGDSGPRRLPRVRLWGLRVWRKCGFSLAKATG